MAIARCGFTTQVVPKPNGGGINIRSGEAMLIERGPTLKVEVGFEAAHQLSVSENQAVASLSSFPPVTSKFEIVDALIDTGALESCIDENLAQNLGLTLIDRRECSGVGRKHELSVYLAHIRIPALDRLQYGKFIGAMLSDGDQSHKVLIGRTLMAGMILSYDGATGAVSLAV